MFLIPKKGCTCVLSGFWRPSLHHSWAIWQQAMFDLPQICSVRYFWGKGFLLLLIKSLKGKKGSHGGRLKQIAAYMKQILSRGKERAFLFGSGLFSLASGMAVGNVAKLIRQSVQHFGPGWIISSYWKDCHEMLHLHGPERWILLTSVILWLLP